MTDKRDYSDYIETIHGFEVQMEKIFGKLDRLEEKMDEVKNQDIPFSKVKIGFKEACVVFGWLLIVGVIPSVSSHFFNASKNNEQDSKIISLSERQDRLEGFYGREHDE